MQPLTDTPPEIAEMVRVRLMALSGAERFRVGAEMFEAARCMALASLPADLTKTERMTVSVRDIVIFTSGGQV